MDFYEISKGRFRNYSKSSNIKKMNNSKQFFNKMIVFCFVLLKPFSFCQASQQDVKFILVDKQNNLLHVALYNEQEYQILKTYPTTLGLVLGDKEQSNDLKTPEGIYMLRGFKYPPMLPKLGSLAIPLNFPNPFDLLDGKSGSGIMIHGTNDPERLKKRHDSEGCVVLANEHIQELSQFVTPGKSPVLIFKELTEGFKKPANFVTAQNFFQSWIQSWRNKDIESYISHYHPSFSSQGKDLKAWKTYKQALNNRYEQIDVSAENVCMFAHPKGYFLVTFTQKYQSLLKKGTRGYQSTGPKMVYLTSSPPQSFAILSENYMGSPH
jgi:murein L,D-transpeptidase YafK